jgi:hypothetical protein
VCSRQAGSAGPAPWEIFKIKKKVYFDNWILYYHTCHKLDMPIVSFSKASGVRSVFFNVQKNVDIIREVGKKDLEEPDSQT